jgi:preprotein translocase subunit YajC
VAACRAGFVVKESLVVFSGWLSTGWLLAAAEGEKVADEPIGSPFGSSFIPFLVVIMVLFWLMVIRPQKTKEREFKAMLGNLKKNDRVVTIGGIHGVVTNFQKEIDRVTIRVDEATGATLRVGLNAIARILGDETEESDKAAGKK